MLASDIAPRWMMAHPKARALVDALDREEAILLPHPAAALPTDPSFAISVLVETVGGTYEWTDGEPLNIDKHD